MTLFIALPFLGFYLGMQYQEKITVNVLTVSEIQKTATQTPPSAGEPELVGKVYWEVENSIPALLEKELKAWLVGYDPQLPNGLSYEIFGVETSSISSNFAVANMDIKDSSADSFQALLYKTGNKWNLTKEVDSNFCTIFKQAPSDLTNLTTAPLIFYAGQYAGCIK
jgi:hypothetical protein